MEQVVRKEVWLVETTERCGGGKRMLRIERSSEHILTRILR